MKVTDDGGVATTTTRALTVQNRAPSASVTDSPDPAPIGTPVTFDASASKDPDGSIVKYEWDLDGNGTYETSTGSTPTATKSYSKPAEVQVGVKVTDNEGLTATATQTARIVGTYYGVIKGTPGLLDYWRLGERTGTTFADSVGANNATMTGTVTLGSPGAIPTDPNSSATFPGGGGANAPVDLSGTSQVTLEFWLNWSAYQNNDQLAFELTPNFNANAGGFLVDPNAGELGGKFGVGIGREGSRNNVYFERPSAGVWHHYALVLDSQAPASEQVTPYVDGNPVSYEKLNDGTGAGNFANSTLNFMSRNGSALFGKGGLDEVALYGRALSPAEVAAHYEAAANKAPTASFTADPANVATGLPVSFDASGSTDADGSIVKYEWDLDGNGSYETTTGRPRRRPRPTPKPANTRWDLKSRTTKAGPPPRRGP